MEIWRRGHIEIEHKNFLEANGIRHEPWFSVKYPTEIRNYIFEICETDPAWSELKKLIGKKHTYVRTHFTDEERLNAEWCIIRGEHSIASLRLPRGYAWSEEFFQKQCKKCGGGWQQIAPFRMIREPRIGKNQFCSFGGGFELFCTPSVSD